MWGRNVLSAMSGKCRDQNYNIKNKCDLWYILRGVILSCRNVIVQIPGRSGIFIKVSVFFSSFMHTLCLLGAFIQFHNKHFMLLCPARSTKLMKTKLLSVCLTSSLKFPDRTETPKLIKTLSVRLKRIRAEY